MSFRRESDRNDEENQQSSSPGLGFAAAAGIGVVIGAGMYYLFKKSFQAQEQQDTRALDPYLKTDLANDSYVTFLENTTTDTSMDDYFSHDDDVMDVMMNRSDQESIIFANFSDGESSLGINNDAWNTTEDVDMSDDEISSHGEEDPSSHDDGGSTSSHLSDSSPSTIASLHMSDSFRTTPQHDNSENVYLDETPSSYAGSDSDMYTSSDTEDNIPQPIQDTATNVFRQRAWSLEQCSICFEVILENHKVSVLPCTHRFHSSCIQPWLQDHKTCPCCRKSV